MEYLAAVSGIHGNLEQVSVLQALPRAHVSWIAFDDESRRIEEGWVPSNAASSACLAVTSCHFEEGALKHICRGTNRSITRFNTSRSDRYGILLTSCRIWESTGAKYLTIRPNQAFPWHARTKRMCPYMHSRLAIC